MRAMLRMLERDGIEIIGEAANGAEAVDMSGRLDPDVVLMDYRMPVMDGIEATRRIKAAHPAVQVVMLTAYDDGEMNVGAKRAGAYAYLVKGCSRRLMRDVVFHAWRFKQAVEERQYTKEALGEALGGARS